MELARYSKKRKFSAGSKYTGGGMGMRGYASEVGRRPFVSKPEKKVIDIQNSISVSSTPTIIPLTDISQGSTAGTRNGNDVKPVSMQVRWSVLCSTTDSYNSVRFLIVQGRDWRVGDPASTDLQANGSQDMLTPLEWHKKARFAILYDSGAVRTRTINVYSGSSPYIVFHHDHHKKLKELPRGSDAINIKLAGRKNVVNRIKFDGTTATTGSGRFWLMVCSDSTAIQHPTVEYYIRTVYRDI